MARPGPTPAISTSASTARGRSRSRAAAMSATPSATSAPLAVRPARSTWTARLGVDEQQLSLRRWRQFLLQYRGQRNVEHHQRRLRHQHHWLHRLRRRLYHWSDGHGNGGRRRLEVVQPQPTLCRRQWSQLLYFGGSEPEHRQRRLRQRHHRLYRLRQRLYVRSHGPGGGGRQRLELDEPRVSLCRCREFSSFVPGSGTLSISNGGAVSDMNGYIGYASASGTVALDRAGSKWTNRRQPLRRLLGHGHGYPNGRDRLRGRHS